MAWGRARKREPLPDPFDSLDELIDGLEEKTGFRVEGSAAKINEGETFRHWCERLAKPETRPDGTVRTGLKVDGKPFKLDDRPAMAWIYDQIPSTEDEAFRLFVVLMKCAQVGFTVMEMLACIYMGLRFGPLYGQMTVGMFLPDMNLTDIKSGERFVPLVRSVPDVHKLMTEQANEGERKKGEGNVRLRRIGQAMFVFSWTSGRASTESVPMDMLSFDEVQEMTLAQIEKTLERLSASQLRFVLMGSTANFPESDIHHWYMRGTQHQFHSECPTCGEAKPLDEYFPDCIKFDHSHQVYRYVCPNGHWLANPQDGRWIAKNPGAEPEFDRTALPKRDWPLRIRSIHFPQFLSPTISATEIFDAYRFAESMKNFYNRKLGKPYLDPSQVPVTLEHLKECERQGIALGLKWEARADGRSSYYMGIDQMGQFNVAVIKKRLPDGRQAIAHLEMIYDESPFARCDELMELFDISVAVCEINPNYNDAKRFANRWKGRVFIVDSFGQVAEGMIQWGDAPKLDVSERRTTDEDRDRYTARIDQFKCMQVSMSRFCRVDPDTKLPAPACLFPDSKGLVQEVIESGHKVLREVAPIAWTHFTKTALVVEISEEDAKKGIKHYRRSVRKIGIDPHFSYANLLCDVAWARAHGTATFLIPQAGDKPAMVKQAEDMNLPGLPVQVVKMLQPVPAGRVCGACTGYDRTRDGADVRSQCTKRNFSVATNDPGCDIFSRYKPKPS